MGEGQEAVDQCEAGGRDDQDTARAQQSAEIHGEWPDEHQRDVECAPDPCAIVEANPQAAFQVGSAETQESAGERDNARAHHDAENAEHGAIGELAGDGAR